MSHTQSDAPRLSLDADVHLTVGPEDDGFRLDDVLARALGLGRRAAVRLVARARRNGRPVAKGERVKAGDRLWVAAVPAPLPSAALEPSIVRMTPEVLVLSKPAGLPSVAIAFDQGPSLAAWIAAGYPECSGLGRPGECGLVHRLDTGTSGLLLVARSPGAHRNLRAQFASGAIRKTYLALVDGDLRRPIVVEAAIGQHPKSRRRMRAITAPASVERYAARPAVTAIAPVRPFAMRTLVRATSATGLRHQIRVHLAHAGHPLCADALYGGAPLPDGSVFLLHAECLHWADPVSGLPHADHAPEPAEWGRVLGALERPVAS